MDRAQSQTVGVVLLTAIVALSVSSTGAVVLNDWQSDIDDGPVADIDAEITPINISLEHRGGDTLYPENTTIRLVGVEEGLTLDERLRPGGSLFSAYDRLEGRIELLVVYDPLDTVVYSESHRIDNPVVGLLFEADDRTDPVYVVEGYGANYTVDKEFELGVSDPVGDRADVTVDDPSTVGVDEGETKLLGVDSGTTQAHAEADNYTAETDVIVLEPDPPLAVETGSASANRDLSVEVGGKLTELGGLPEVNLSISYWPDRIFNAQPANNSDSVVADGSFWTNGPDGYAHDDNFVHDNRPLEAGETRSYVFDRRGATAQYRWFLRDKQQPTPTGSIVDNVYTGGDTRTLPNGKYRIEVTLSDDGSTADVALYNRPEGGSVVTADRDISVGGHSKLYFSNYEYSGTTGRQSLRLIGIETRTATEQALAAAAVDEPRSFSTELTGLEPDRGYTATAVAEERIGNRTLNATGDESSFRLDSPTIETVGTTLTGGRSAEAAGNVTSMGDLVRTELFFEYWPSRIFNEQSTNNSDSVIADGDFVSDPDGYAHDNKYVHDNQPLEAGETRTYVFDKRSSTAQYRWYLRDEQQLDATRAIANDVYRGGDTRSLPADQYRIEVSVSDDGSTADVVLYDEPEDGSVVTAERDISVDGYSELYFSNYEYNGESGADSLRLLDIDTYSATEQAVASNETAGPFHADLTGLELDRDYAIRARSENDSVNPPVTSAGDVVTFTMDSPTVETLDVTASDARAVDATGELVDLGGLRGADLSFEYWPSRIFNEQSTNNSDSVIADGDFWTTDPDGYAHDNKYVHDNQPLEAGETRTYVFDKRGSTAQYRWYLRDEQQLDATRAIANDVYRGGDTRSLPADQYRIEVSVSDDGSTADVVLYNEPEGGSVVTAERGISVGSYSELYFSNYEYSGEEGDQSLRLLDIDTYSATEQAVAETDTDQLGNFSTEITGLEVDREYAIAAHVDNATLDPPVNASGEPISFESSRQTVDTLDLTTAGGGELDATGELVDLGDVDSTDAAFNYWPSRIFNEQPTNNSDSVLAYGSFWEDPDGYAHDNDYVHDNRPLEAGETRTYVFDKRTSGAEYRWFFRNAEASDPDEISTDVHTGGDTRALPADQYRIEVTLSDDGSTADVVLYSEREGGSIVMEERGISVGSYSDLYFSSYEYNGEADDEGSLRLLGIETFSSTGQLDVETNLTAPTTYSDTISGLETNRDYAVTAFVETDSVDPPVNATGDRIRAETD